MSDMTFYWGVVCGAGLTHLGFAAGVLMQRLVRRLYLREAAAMRRDSDAAERLRGPSTVLRAVQKHDSESAQPFDGRSRREGAKDGAAPR